MSITSANAIYGTMDYGGDLNNAPIMTQAPRQKFKFEVEFVGLDVRLPIKSVNLPDISFENKIVQQFNAKRVVQQKINYGTCTITLVDTFDNIFTDSIYLPYVENYYNNGKGISSARLSDTDLRSPSGFTAPAATNRTILEKVNIYLDGGGNDNTKKYTLHGCYFVSINNDILDYAESQPVMYTLVIQPELVSILTENSQASNESLASSAPALATSNTAQITPTSASNNIINTFTGIAAATTAVSGLNNLVDLVGSQQFQLPSINIPSVSFPSMTIPSINIGGSTLPSVNIPSISLPSVNFNAGGNLNFGGINISGNLGFNL